MHGIAKQQREFDGAVLRRAGAGVVAGGDPVGHFRQQHGADGNADDADRQLVDPIGVIQRRNRARRQKARDDGIGEQRELRACGADRRRHERLEEPAHILVEAERVERGERAGADRVATDERRLQHARDQHAPGRGVAGAAEQTRAGERRHHRQVEQDRRRRRRRETMQRVEDAAP